MLDDAFTGVIEWIGHLDHEEIAACATPTLGGMS